MREFDEAVRAEGRAKNMHSFKRVVAIAVIVAVLGGGSLAAGLGVGFFLGDRAAPVAQATDAYPEESTGFSFADQQAERLPVIVRVSDITGVVRDVSPSVVSINFVEPVYGLFGGRGPYRPGSGSGIIFAEDEHHIYIATNNHVVYGAANLTISLDDEYQIPATFVRGDMQADLAVISVPKAALAGKEFALATFGDSEKVRVGDEVVAIGNAMGEGQSATYGIVSALNRRISVDGLTLSVLQTDAAINPGNSGGALANIHGEIIGINTAKAIATDVAGMGYAIPSNQALAILEPLLTDATTPRPYLGITPFNVDERLRSLYHWASVGVMIRDMGMGSPAALAGLQPWDLITAFDDTVIRTADDLVGILARSAVGQEVTLHVYRNGVDSMRIAVVLGNANAP